MTEHKTGGKNEAGTQSRVFYPYSFSSNPECKMQTPNSLRHLFIVQRRIPKKTPDNF